MTTKRITLKQATDELKQNQISLTKTEGEYRVAPKGTRRDDTYGSAYFTNDLHDALMTGLAMARKAGTLFEAAQWLKTLEQAAALKGSR